MKDYATEEKVKKLTGRTAEMHMDGDGILHITMLDGAELDLEDIKENLEMARKLTGGKRALKLIDAKGFFSVTKEARDFAASKETDEFNLARAVVSSSLANRLLINFFIRFHRPKSPLKIFSSEEEAIRWLKKFKE